MKPDELALLKALAATGRREEWNAENLMAQLGMPLKRGEYLLLKWTRRRWWEFGVSLRSGWFTPEGREALAKLGIEVIRTPYPPETVVRAVGDAEKQSLEELKRQIEQINTLPGIQRQDNGITAASALRLLIERDGHR